MHESASRVSKVDAPAEVLADEPARHNRPRARGAHHNSNQFDSAVMAERGRIGGYVTHAFHDSREITAPARRAFLARFEAEVDPDGKLPEDERLRRAERARRAYFRRLALKSAEARRARAS